jgi:hypothetical protein
MHKQILEASSPNHRQRPRCRRSDSAWPSRDRPRCHRAHVAFETLERPDEEPESIQNRRKAIIHQQRLTSIRPSRRGRRHARKDEQDADDMRLDPFVIETATQNAFNENDLIYELPT